MSGSFSELKTFIEIVPEPHEVRTRLGQSLRVTKILRQLLRVSEKAAKERDQQHQQHPRREVARA